MERFTETISPGLRINEYGEVRFLACGAGWVSSDSRATRFYRVLRTARRILMSKDPDRNRTAAYYRADRRAEAMALKAFSSISWPQTPATVGS